MIIKATRFLKLFCILAAGYIAFSCQRAEEKNYAEIFYHYAPGALTPMELYCKCIPMNDLQKKQFQYSFTVKGDSLSKILKHFEELKSSGSIDTINVRAFILLHNSGHTDTLCAGYRNGIRLNGQIMQENAVFTNEVATLIAQHHGQLTAKKFGKH